jgi:hypothetical protein
VVEQAIARNESIIPDQHDGAKYTKTKYAKPERTSMLTNFFYTKPSAASSSNGSNGLVVDSKGLAAESSVLDPIKIQMCMALHFDESVDHNIESYLHHKRCRWLFSLEHKTLVICDFKAVILH